MLCTHTHTTATSRASYSLFKHAKVEACEERPSACKTASSACDIGCGPDDLEIALPARADGDGADVDVLKEETVPVSTALLVWVRFLPALIFYPIWFRIMVAYSLWAPAYKDGWPMALAMVAGSLIAGSTPLGGGVVAFPVSVLVLKLSAKEGRDFACLIQSVSRTFCRENVCVCVCVCVCVHLCTAGAAPARDPAACS